MQRRQRRGFAPPSGSRHQRLALVQHILLDLLQAGHRQLPRLFVCAIMGHEKELLSALQRSFERIVLLFCSFGNPLSYFVGVNVRLPRPSYNKGLSKTKLSRCGIVLQEKYSWREQNGINRGGQSTAVKHGQGSQRQRAPDVHGANRSSLG